MDLPWFELPPGYQFLHCLVNDANGGDSSAIDGFAVADYLRQNESLDTQNMTFLVRQLAPTNQGVSIQIYTFTKTTDWVEYEKIQSDIFDHLLAVLHKFDLRAYQDGIVEAAAMKNLHFNEGLKD